MFVGYTGDWDACIDRALLDAPEGYKLLTVDDIQQVQPSFMGNPPYILLDAWLLSNKDCTALMGYAKTLEIYFIFAENKVPSSFKGRLIAIDKIETPLAKQLLRRNSGEAMKGRDSISSMYSLTLEMIAKTEDVKQRSVCRDLLRDIMVKRVFDYDRAYIVRRLCLESSKSSFKHSAWWH